MKGLEGQLRWNGPDPDVIHFTDNGKRKVQMRIAWDGIEVSFVVRNVDALIDDLRIVQAWTRDKEPVA